MLVDATTEGSYRYTFQDIDSPSTIVFVDQEDDHCEEGQIVKFNVVRDPDGCGGNPCDQVTPVGCFSGTTEVQVRGQGAMAIKDVRVNDWLLDADGSYQKVYALGHHQPEQGQNVVPMSLDN